ncbi:MAG: FGGY-family carbohydrate kinase [Proteobacteria bacterium]|nr:FGGY-family carbohydrate kinase [Pseudomonadota bacterium]
METKTILAIDSGTQSLRALLFAEDGTLLARDQQSYSPYYSLHPGWAEQDPDIYWNSLAAACNCLKKKQPLAFAAIAGVGVASQRASLINVDKEGRVLRPAIIWLDQRAARPVFGAKGVLNFGLRLTGLEKKLMDIQSQGKGNWIIQNQPEIWEKTHKYLQVSGFLNHRLTGEFADSVASQIGHLPFDYKRQKWAGRWTLPNRLFPVEIEKLPTLIAPGQLIGQVTASAGELTGLRSGIPVIACGSDKGCETLGAGVTNQKMVSLSFGTTATVQTTSQKYFEAIRFMPPYPSPVPGCYNPEVEIFRGFWMISWFKQEFAHKEVAEAQKLGIDAEEVLNRCLERTSPGAMGLVVQPYWGPGLEHPDAKGAMIGFGDVHTKDHVYRAVIEGLGFALYEGMEKIEKKGGVCVEKAAVSGGASQSDEICKITADIFNLPMVKGQTHETTGLGAAIITAVGVGLYPGIDEAVAQMVRVKTVFEPDPKNVLLYRQLYQKVYQGMYKALAPLYAQIQKITGYPKR